MERLMYRTIAMLVTLVLLSGLIVPKARAQAGTLAPIVAAELLTPVRDYVQVNAAPYPLISPQIEEGRSGDAVFLGSVLGAIAGTLVVTVSSFMEDQSPAYLLPAGVASGAAVGGMAGAALSQRRAAPVSTGVGALVGSIPLFAVTAATGKADDRYLLPAMVLPILGTVLGNKWGQD
jgi:peptidoglycan/LPS O-acetylase OafA/YrhL